MRNNWGSEVPLELLCSCFVVVRKRKSSLTRKAYLVGFKGGSYLKVDDTSAWGVIMEPSSSWSRLKHHVWSVGLRCNLCVNHQYHILSHIIRSLKTFTTYSSHSWHIHKIFLTFCKIFWQWLADRGTVEHRFAIRIAVRDPFPQGMTYNSFNLHSSLSCTAM